MRDPELSPEQEERVRRLLAEARHDEPIPSDVADRLERTLATLGGSPLGKDGGAPVIDLAARRRRRNAAALLAGAAAVIVGGFVAGQAIDVGDAGGAGSDTAAQPVDRDDEGGGDTAFESGAAGSTSANDDAAAPEALVAGPPLKLTSDHLQSDLTAQLPDAVANSRARDSAPEAVEPLGCATAEPSRYGTGKFFAAYYDGIPAVLALRPPAGDTQQAEVLECDTAAPLGSATLPSR